MKSVEALYSAYLLERKSPQDIFATQPRAPKSVTAGGGFDQQYGRPISYYQQLQSLDLMSAWSGVRVPVLAMHGEYDWIMTGGDFQLIAETREWRLREPLFHSSLPATTPSITMTPCAMLSRETPLRSMSQSRKGSAIG